MVGLAQIANTLEALSDVVTTGLASLVRKRLAEGIDLARLRDDSTSEFVEAVIYNLEQAVATIEQPSQAQAAEVLAAKGRIQNLADSVRTSLLSKLQLSEKKDATTFSLATDMIEQFKQIAHFARQTATVTWEWTRGKAVSNPAS
jgi:phosphate:Na+ symporter